MVKSSKGFMKIVVAFFIGSVLFCGWPGNCLKIGEKLFVEDVYANEADEIKDFSAELSEIKEKYDINKTFIPDIVINTVDETVSVGGETYEDVVVEKEGEVCLDVDKLSEIVQDQDLESDKMGDTVGVEEIAEKIDAEIVMNDEKSIILSKEYQTCRIIVKSSQKVADGNALAIAGPFNDLYVLQYCDTETAKKACEFFQKQEYVEYAQASRICAMDVTKKADYEMNEVTYSDFNKWGYEACSFQNIVDLIESTYEADQIDPITVAVIDSGIDKDHPAFNGRLAGSGYDFANDDDDVTDDYMHGTAVAGVIALNTPDYVKVLPVKAGNADGIEMIDAYNAIEYAITQKSKVINMSFSMSVDDAVMHEAIKKAAENDVVLVGSYGNNARYTTGVYPACYEEVICVSSIDSMQNLSDFSNYGPEVDVTAPGTQIYTTYPTYMGDGSGYAMEDGTSYSTPFTAAALAMIRVLNPTASAEEIGNLLYANAYDLGEKGWDTYYGYGMISFDAYENKYYEASIDLQRYVNLEEAVAAAQDGDVISLLKNVELNAPIICDKDFSIVASKNQKLYRENGFTGSLFEIEQGATLTLGIVTENELNKKLTIDGSYSEENTDPIISVKTGGTCILGNGVTLKSSNTSLNGSAISNNGIVEFYQTMLVGCNIYNSGTIKVMGQMQADAESVITSAESKVIIVQKQIDLDRFMCNVLIENEKAGDCVIQFADGLTCSRMPFIYRKDGYELYIEGQKLIIRECSANEAKIDDVTYATLSDALTAAKDGDTIQIIKDIAIDSSIIIDKNIILSATEERWLRRDSDFSGDMIVINENACLTLTGTPDVGRTLCLSGGKIPVSASIIAIALDGELIIEDAYIVGSDTDKMEVSAIKNEGYLEINGGTLGSNNNKQAGAAIYNATYGQVVMKGGKIVNNHAESGGAIYNLGSITMNGGIIEKNTALFGGAVYNVGRFTLDGGEISRNECLNGGWFTSNGGAIYNTGELFINDGEIAENKVAESGGAIYNAGSLRYNEQGDIVSDTGIIHLNGGIIKNNVSSSCEDASIGSTEGVLTSGQGGAVFNWGIMEMTGGVIEDNEAGVNGCGILNKGKFIMKAGEIRNNVFSVENGRGYKTSHGRELHMDPMLLSDDTYVSSISSLIGGKIYDDEKESEDPIISSWGGEIEIGGEFFLGGCSRIYEQYFHGDDLVKGQIKIIDTFDNNGTIIYLQADERDKGVGDVAVTFADSVVVNAEVFREYDGRDLKVDGQNLIITDDFSKLIVQGIFGDLEWKICDNTITISGTGDMQSFPDSTENSAKYPWAVYKNAVKEVIIEDGVSLVGAYSFKDFLNLETIKIADSVRFVHGGAFSECPNLKTIFGGNGIEQLASDVFFVTREDIGELDVQSDSYILLNYDWNQSKWMPNTNKFFYQECADGTLRLGYIGNEKELVVPSEIDGKQVRYLDRFDSDYNLETVIIPSTVKEIEYGAFYHSVNLKKMYVPASVDRFDTTFFWNCPNLTVYGEKDSYVQQLARDAEVPFEVCQREHEFVWSSDNETAQCLLKFFPGSDLGIKYEAVVSKIILSEADCIHGNVIEYTASYGDYTDKKVIEDSNIKLDRHNYQNGVCTKCNAIYETNVNGILYKVVTKIDETTGKPIGQTVTVSENDIPQVAVSVIGVDDTLEGNSLDGKVMIPSTITGSGSEQTFMVTKISDHAFASEASNAVTEIVVPATVTEVENGAFGNATTITFNGNTVPSGIASAISEAVITVNVPEGAGESFKETLGDSVTIVEVHTHTFDTKWTYDETHHWHAATCGHEEETADKAEHTYGDWVTVTEATEDTKGLKEKSCACGYKEAEEIAQLPHTHKYADTWTYDETGHWKATICGHDGEEGVLDIQTHTFGEWTVVQEATEDAEGLKERSCTCGYKETVTIEKLAHITHVKDKGTRVEPTCEKKGSITYKCTMCDEVMEVVELAIIGHKWDVGTITREPTTTESGIKIYKCQNNGCFETKTETIPAKETSKVSLKKGDTIVDEQRKGEYEITSIDSKAPTVTYEGSAYKTAKEVTIPKTVTVDDTTYKVTKIADKAFKGNKTITKAIIGSNVTVIGKDAFNGCKKLATVTIGKNVTTIENNAFKGCSSLKSLKLDSKVTKLGSNAFNGCKKLKTLTIKSTKLNDKNVSKNAFKGITKNTIIKVPKKKLLAYKKLFKKKGLSSKVKVVAI